MADLADVEDALVNFVNSVLYPDGTDVLSTVGTDCRIFRGWPLPASLNADLAAGMVNVTVFPSITPGRSLPPLPIIYDVGAVMPAFAATVVGTNVTFSGTPLPGHSAGVLIDGVSYVYRPQSGDTPAGVAATFAALVGADQIVRLSGATLTVPGASRLVARVVADTASLRETRRQEREVIVACWCPTPSVRDIVAAAIDVALAGINFLALGDGTSGRLHYHDTAQYDQAQNALLYRRDLVYSIEYPTVIRKNEPAMLFGDLKIGIINTIV